MTSSILQRLRRSIVVLFAVLLVGANLAPTRASAASAGLAVVIANSYDGFLPSSVRDAGAIADRLEQDDFDAVRMLGAAGGEMIARIGRLGETAAAAGPKRFVYMSGFGMCFNDDLVLFAEDMQPEQFKSGQIGEVVVPLSVVLNAIAEGAGETLVVFDTTPRQCTRDMIDAVKLPENTVLVVTTGIGGDVIDEVDEGGMSAFATAFINSFAADRPIKELANQVAAEISEMTEDQQKPIVVANP
jgi:hypothetical protein